MATTTRRWKTPRAIVALMLREMATTYGRSAAGYIWAILEPVAAIAILSTAFSLILRAPSLGSHFALFYATAYLPFILYSTLTTKLLTSIKFSRQLLTYPSVTFSDAILARFGLTVLTHLLVFYIVISGIMLIFDTRSILHFPAILSSLAMASALGFGLGCLNCFLASCTTLWANIWGIINRPVFILSGVFFLYEDVPANLRTYLWYNPMIHITGEMRRGFYPTYDAPYVSYVYVFGVACLCGTLGLLLLARFHRDILNDL